jgi:hypothetical protein
VKCGEHNHPPLTREVAHPSHRKMTNDVKECVRTLSAAIQILEPAVVKIKGRRQDKGGGGWEKQINRVGGSTPNLLFHGFVLHMNVVCLKHMTSKCKKHKFMKEQFFT